MIDFYDQTLDFLLIMQSILKDFKPSNSGQRVFNSLAKIQKKMIQNSRFCVENRNTAEMMIQNLDQNLDQKLDQKSKRRPKDHHSKSRVGKRSEKFFYGILSILHLI